MPSRKTERLKTLFKQDEFENAYFGASVRVDEKTFWKRSFYGYKPSVYTNPSRISLISKTRSSNRRNLKTPPFPF